MLRNEHDVIDRGPVHSKEVAWALSPSRIKGDQILPAIPKFLTTDNEQGGGITTDILGAATESGGDVALIISLFREKTGRSRFFGAN